MGNNASGQNTVRQMRQLECPPTSGPSERDVETTNFMNDMVKLVPSEDVKLGPNSVISIEKRECMTPTRYKTFCLLHRLTPINRMIDLSEEELKKIDDHATQVPRTAMGSFKDVVEYLKQSLEEYYNEEQLLIRSFLIWLAKEASIAETEDGSQSKASFRAVEEQGKSPSFLLNLLMDNKTTFTSIFILLCWAAGIKCVKIEGVCRTGDAHETLPCAWTAVFVNNAWQIVHPHRVCRALNGKFTEDLIRQNTNEVTKEFENTIKKSFLEFYIFSNPEHFCYEYFSNNPRWQLLPKAISKESFTTRERVYHTWWKTGLKLLSHHNHSLVSEDGRITIAFSGTDNSSTDLVLCCDLKLIQSDSVSINDTLCTDILQRMVYLIRNGNSWQCHILLPVTGLYKALFYASNSQMPLLKICEFEIVCHICHPDPIPLPIDTDIIGIGPGPKLTTVGLLYPSHKNGIITADVEKSVKMIFRMNNTSSRDALFKAEVFFIDTNQKADENNNCLKARCKILQRRTYIELMVVVDSPKQPCQYLLEISKETHNAEQTEFSAVCYYMLVYEENFEEESYGQKTVRRMLIEEMESEDIVEILLRIQDCAAKRISEWDLNVQRARGRVSFLKNKKKKDLGTDDRLEPVNSIRQAKYETRLYALTKHLEELKILIQSQEDGEAGQLSVDGSLQNADNMNLLDSEIHEAILLVKTLFGNISEDNQVDDILHEIKHSGLILTQENVRKAATITEKYTYEQKKSLNTQVSAAVIQSVKAIVDMMNGY